MTRGQVRARVRQEMVTEITAAASEELVEAGAGGLSLRAVARRMEMVPSALYRYFDSRDHLLTALIVDAYEDLARVAGEAAIGAGADPWARWAAIGAAARCWSATHPQRWALVFGSPVTGYEGTDATTAAALHFHLVAVEAVAEAHRRGALSPAVVAEGRGVEAVAPLAALVDLPTAVASGALAAWSSVLGHISLERFGHLVGTSDDADARFATVLVLAASLVGLAPSAGPVRSAP